jgi:hypothetical protein
MFDYYVIMVGRAVSIELGALSAKAIVKWIYTSAYFMYAHIICEWQVKRASN